MWIGRSEDVPRAGSQVVLAASDGVFVVNQRQELLRIQLAEANEPIETGKPIDADQLCETVGRMMPTDAGQRTDEIELVEQVVFEPQNDFFVISKTVERSVARHQLARDGGCLPWIVGEELAAQLVPLLIVDRRRRSFVQHIGKCDDRIGDELSEPGRDAVAVGDMQRAHAILYTCTSSNPP